MVWAGGVEAWGRGWLRELGKKEIELKKYDVQNRTKFNFHSTIFQIKTGPPGCIANRDELTD